MSRTKHARTHAHKWDRVDSSTSYRGKVRIVTTQYRCTHPGCFAGKWVTK